MAAKNPFAAIISHYHFHVAQLAPSVSSAEPVTVSLVPNPSTDTGYDCISYDRSQDHGTAKIVFAGTEIDVPTNLESALRTLRDPHSPRFVWADLLLGQTSEQRSELAKLGKQVLQNASSTIAWLGPGDDMAPKAFDNIKTLAIWWHQAAVRSNFPENLTRATSQQMLASWEYLKAQNIGQLNPGNERLWAAMAAVFDSPYFNTVQTIPDVILSSKTLITCGTQSLSWDDLLAASCSLPVIMGQVLGKTPPEGVIRLLGIQTARRRYLAGETLELLPMIHTARDAKSADPREYVFAMLPICKQSLRQKGLAKSIPLPTIDYTKSVEAVFTDAATYIVQDRNDLLLWYSERPPNARRIKDMPSWVPDWTTPLPKDSGGRLPFSSETEPSLRTWSDSVQPQRRITVEQNKLCLQVHKFDRIATISQKFTMKNYCELMYSLWKACPTWAFANKDECADAFWRTCILNVGGPTDTLREQAPPQKEKVWPSFVSLIAQGQILERLGCTMEQLNTDKALQERAQSDQFCREQATLIGQDRTFEQMLLGKAIGRRFFVTESGRMGMTAFEKLPEPTEGAGEDAKLAEVFDMMNAPQLDNPIIPSPFAPGVMQESFINFMRQRDPASAANFERILKLKDEAQGAKVGDIIVAAVGGFAPYVLRRAGEDGGSNSGESIRGKEFRYVGDCYLHGVMRGEPFSNTNWLGRHSWKTDVRVDDIKIV